MLKTDFNIEDNESKNELKRLMDNIQKNNINYENAQEQFNEYINSMRGLLINISNDNREYIKEVNSLNQQEADTSKPIVHNEWVRKKAFDTLLEAHKRLVSMHSFRTIQAEASTMMSRKLAVALARSKSLDIERLALEQFREMNRESFKFYKEQVAETLSTFKKDVELSYKEQTHYVIEAFKEDHQKNREILMTVIDFLSNTSASNVGDAYEIESRSEKEYKKIVDSPPPFMKSKRELMDSKLELDDETEEADDSKSEYDIPNDNKDIDEEFGFDDLTDRNVGVDRR